MAANTHLISLSRTQAHLICGALNTEAQRFERMVSEQMIGEPVARVPAQTVEVWNDHAKTLLQLSRDVLAAVTLVGA